VLYGTPMQINFDQALRAAEQCIQTQHKVIKPKLKRIGLSYNEREKQWLYQPLLPA
jgi:hypothetical protein